MIGVPSQIPTGPVVLLDESDPSLVLELELPSLSVSSLSVADVASSVDPEPSALESVLASVLVLVLVIIIVVLPTVIASSPDAVSVPDPVSPPPPGDPQPPTIPNAVNIDRRIRNKSMSRFYTYTMPLTTCTHDVPR
jgi:hypothetical protein